MKNQAITKRSPSQNSKSAIRLTLISLFQKAPKPLTVVEIRKQLLKMGIVRNKTTIYRQIDNLLRHKIITKLDLSTRAIHYEISNQPHHHHLICLGCQKIQTIKSIPLETSIIKLNSRLHHGFKITKHQVEFYGWCKNCR